MIPTRKLLHCDDIVVDQVLSLATCVKKPVISVIARPLDESPAASMEKTWAVQILDGPEDILQNARLLKVRKKVRTRRARQRSGGSGASEQLLYYRQPKARSCTKISVRVGLSGLEKCSLSKRKRVRRPYMSNVNPPQVERE